MVGAEERVLEIAHKHKLGHLSSYLSCLPIIDEIYQQKRNKDVFILSCGHAAVALYAILEKYEGQDAEKLFLKHGGHPHHDEAAGIYCSTGSLGMGITVAGGRALANPSKQIYVLISDGESFEGSVWESLRFIHDNNISNIQVYANVNGYSAYDKVNVPYLIKRLTSFLPSIHIRRSPVNQYPFLRGLNAHYHVMSQEDYNSTFK